MDKQAANNDDAFSESEQEVAATTSSSPSLLHHVEDLQAQQFPISENNPVEVNVSSDMNSSAQPLQLVSHQEGLMTHSAQFSNEKTSLLDPTEDSTINSDLKLPDTAAENAESQSVSFHWSATSGEDKPVVDTLEKLALSHVNVNSSLEQTDPIHNISLASSHVSSPSDIPKSLEEGQDIITQDQLKLEGVHSPKPAGNDSQIESCSPCNQVTSSVANVTLSETQNAVPYLDTCTAGETAEAGACSTHESVYYIKWIMFGQSSVPIITQNENGPCPLLAIMNVLLLKEKVKLAPMLEMITSEQLMTYLGECIFENMPQNLSETTQANYEQNMQDAMSVMYKLQTGLDVNVRFTGAGDFEYTPELIIFDLLEISLYHGWIVDPQDSDTVTAVNLCSYNQLVEKIISLRQSEEEESVRQALITEQFLERTASQLTYHGLCELSSVVKEKELCVFFRNNHFNTLYKHNNELFLLVTDQGFLTESNVVWETLSNVDGDCHFTDATFRTYTKPAPSTVPIPDPSIPVGSPEQIDHDYQVALFLQEEDASLQKQAWESGQQEPAAYAYTDHDLAMHLQEEENRKATGEHQRTTPETPILDPLSQGQSRHLSHGPPSEAQRRRGERKEKEEKSCSVL